LEEGPEVGVQVGSAEVAENAENMEVTEDVRNTERVENVGTEKTGAEDETMRDA
jgi:hypothetical protein